MQLLEWKGTGHDCSELYGIDYVFFHVDVILQFYAKLIALSKTFFAVYNGKKAKMYILLNSAFLLEIFFSIISDI